MTWLLASWQSIHKVPCLCYDFTKCQLICTKNSFAACRPNRNDLSPDLELPCLRLQRWLVCWSHSSLGPSTPWGANLCPRLLEMRCLVLQNPSNGPWLAAAVTHYQSELDLRNQLLVKGHLKHLLFVVKLSFAGKMPLNTRYLRNGEVGSDLFVYVPYRHSGWPSLGLWWDLKSRVLKMLFVRACVPEQYGVKSS